MIFSTFIQGFFLGASLIIAIGLQNAFILRQSLTNRHVFISALTASLCDVFLIILGVCGFAAFLEEMPWLENLMITGAVIFLFFYGLKSFYSATKLNALDDDKAKGLAGQGSLKETIIAILGISLLNPHALLDTVVLLGSLSAAYPVPTNYVFGLGAIASSFTWFFTLAYGGRYLSRYFQKPKAWQILDVLIGIVMWLIAGSLTYHMLG